MKYLLDANTVIMLLSGPHPVLADRVRRCDEGDLGVSAIVFAEVALGSTKGRPPPMGALDAFLRDVALVPFDETAARAYATLPFRRASFDRLIAAHALSLGLTLVTANERDFMDVPGLVVENWAK